MSDLQYIHGVNQYSLSVLFTVVDDLTLDNLQG